jgi:2'-5' RNA ligase
MPWRPPLLAFLCAGRSVAFIGLKVPTEVSDVLGQYEVPGKLEPEDHHHVTIHHLGKDVPIEQVAQAAIVAYVTARRTAPFQVSTKVISSFKSGDDGVPIVALIESPALHEFRKNLCAAFDAAGIEYSKKYPEYRPHVTLAYEDSGPQPADQPIDPVTWTVDEIVVWGGDKGANRIVVKLPLEAEQEDETLSLRVAARSYVTASLANDFQRKMKELFADSPLQVAKGTEIADWMTDNFAILSSKTPKGQKALKEEMLKLHWWLKSGINMHDMATPEREKGVRDTIEAAWSKIEPQLDALTRYFSSEGGKVVPKELKLDGNVFINSVGFDEKKLALYAGRLDAIFKDLKGWRKGALTGGLKVVLASPADFGGSHASGKYKSDSDTLLVRATPAVLSRSGKSYGSFEYIIVHELGHRYDHKHHVPVDFARSEWNTTPYSAKDGFGALSEQFAELFALTNFGITSAHTTWDPKITERFEKIMSGGVAEKPELPEHLKQFSQSR